MKNKNLARVSIIVLYSDNIILIKRRKNPFKGYWELPNGEIDDETQKQAAMRILAEETGIVVQFKDIDSVSDNICMINLTQDEFERFMNTMVYGKQAWKSRIPFCEEVLFSNIFSLNELPRKMILDHRKIIMDFVGNIE